MFQVSPLTRKVVHKVTIVVAIRGFFCEQAVRGQTLTKSHFSRNPVLMSSPCRDAKRDFAHNHLEI